MERKHNLSDALRNLVGLIIEPAVFSPTELLKSEKKDKEFLSLVSEGIVLWDRLIYEDSF